MVRVRVRVRVRVGVGVRVRVRVWVWVRVWVRGRGRGRGRGRLSAPASDASSSVSSNCRSRDGRFPEMSDLPREIAEAPDLAEEISELTARSDLPGRSVGAVLLLTLTRASGG